MVQSLGAQITLLLEHVKGGCSAAVAQLPATEMPTSGMAASMSAPEMASAQALPIMAAIPCPQLSQPQHFDSESGNIQPFLTQSELHFELQAAFLVSERAKIAHIILSSSICLGALKLA